MLHNVITAYEREIESMAQAWLAVGASAFGIRSQGQLLWQMPDPAPWSDRAIEADIEYGGLPMGELFVQGTGSPMAKVLIRAQAQLLARLTLTEGQIEEIAAELINYQDRLVALYNIMHSTRRMTSVDDLLNALVQAASQLFPVEAAFICWEKNGGEMEVFQHPHLYECDLLRPFVEEAKENGKYLLANGRYTTKQILPDRIQNLLLIPIFLDEATAAVGLINKADGPFSSPAIKLLQGVADYTETELENVLLHEQRVEQAKEQTRMKTEMELARKVQMQLMPQRLPEVEGVMLAAKTKPALSVGGDFYDCLVQRGGNCFFTLGDVSGKGMSAALLMAMTRTTMRHAAKIAYASPEKILDQTNQVLYDDFTEVGMFATVFVGHWSLSKKRLTFANAGHAPVIHKPAGQPAYMMEATGTALCVLPENLATEMSVPFGTGDLLVVASDGLNEASNPAGEMFDYERLICLVDEIAELPAAEIVEALYQRVAEFSQGREQEDDQTVFVLKGS